MSIAIFNYQSAVFFSLYYYDEQEVEDEDIEDYEERKQMPILSLLAICPCQKETPCTESTSASCWKDTVRMAAKSCTSWYNRKTMKHCKYWDSNSINHLPTGAGFLHISSTVSPPLDLRMRRNPALIDWLVHQLHATPWELTNLGEMVPFFTPIFWAKRWPNGWPK